MALSIVISNTTGTYATIATTEETLTRDLSRIRTAVDLYKRDQPELAPWSVKATGTKTCPICGQSMSL